MYMFFTSSDSLLITETMISWKVSFRTVVILSYHRGRVSEITVEQKWMKMTVWWQRGNCPFLNIWEGILLQDREKPLERGFLVLFFFCVCYCCFCFFFPNEQILHFHLLLYIRYLFICLSVGWLSLYLKRRIYCNKRASLFFWLRDIHWRLLWQNQIEFMKNYRDYVLVLFQEKKIINFLWNIYFSK